MRGSGVGVGSARGMGIEVMCDECGLMRVGRDGVLHDGFRRDDMREWWELVRREQ